MLSSKLVYFPTPPQPPKPANSMPLPAWKVLMATRYPDRLPLIVPFWWQHERVMDCILGCPPAPKNDTLAALRQRMDRSYSRRSLVAVAGDMREWELAA